MYYKKTYGLNVLPDYMIPDELTNYVNEKVPQNFHFELPLTSEDWVLNELHKINEHKAVGYDDISGLCLRSCSHAIARQLTNIINTSIRTACFQLNGK